MKNVCNNVRVSSYCICYLDGNIKSENTRTFTYDNLGRLKQEQDGTDTICYTYDKFGNRSTMTNNETVTSYTYDLNNRLLQEVSGDEFTFYNYDNRGNLYSKRTEERSAAGGLTRVDTFGALKDNTNSTVEIYSYNGLNRMSEVHKGGVTAQYTYNAEGIRTSKTVNGVTIDFLLDGSNVVAETKDNITTNYIRGVSGIVSSSIQGTNGSTKYYTSDGHGNITNLIDSTGSIVQTYVYDAFGVEQNIDSNDTNPFRYCGEYYDSEINQIYLRARYYNPTLGRFNQSDPAMSRGNWYVYCSNNPILYDDPLGLSSKPVGEDYPDMSKYFQALVLYEIEEGAPNALDYERDSAYNQALSEYDQKVLLWGLSSKGAIREFWAAGAEMYLRKRGYITAAWLLEHSLQDNPSDVYRYNDSNIARLINNDSNFNQGISNVLQLYNYVNLPYFYVYNFNVFFSNGDLAASLYHCNDITLEGWRQKNGSWVIHVSLHDVYDFTEILTVKVKNGETVFDINTLTVANDLAHASQQAGAISPYDIYVDFWITR